jgi:2-desacetyl-2-hydroxyethyl bacteriochlorophyllide A dehydrogenase
MRRRSLYFANPFDVRIEEEDCPEPGQGQVLVRAEMSAISPGTEMLFYRGQAPEGMAVDAAIPALAGPMAYPLKYGYSSVGTVAGAGPGADRALLGRRVFSFHPHESHYVAEAGEIVPLPRDVAQEDALFLPAMETALGLVMDGAPMVGETAVVVGQGIIGLLASALLAGHPLERLVTFDRFPLRRQASLAAGAHMSLDPEDGGGLADILALFGPGRADLVFELSGQPQALDLAIELAGFGGRIVVGSWYGRKRHPVDLGGRFHRERITLAPSQVSTIAPRLAGRWTKGRRLDLAWRMLARLRPSRFITQTIPFDRAREAFALLDTAPDQAIQVVLAYGNGPDGRGRRPTCTPWP